jgi:hypothetical protein
VRRATCGRHHHLDETVSTVVPLPGSRVREFILVHALAPGLEVDSIFGAQAPGTMPSTTLLYRYAVKDLRVKKKQKNVFRLPKHDVAFHYPRWTIALWGIISNAYNAFKCTQTHHTTA